MKTIACLAFTAAIFLFSCHNNESSEYNGWQRAHGNANGNKYSSLAEIDTNNVIAVTGCMGISYK